MKPKPFVGQKVCLVRFSRYNISKPQSEAAIVEKVGRKYFVVRNENGNFRDEFLLEDWTEHTEYSSSVCAYATEQEWLNEQEASEILKFLREIFSRGSSIASSLPLESLRKIRAIIEIEGKP